MKSHDDVATGELVGINELDNVVQRGASQIGRSGPSSDAKTFSLRGRDQDDQKSGPLLPSSRPPRSIHCTRVGIPSSYPVP